MQLLILPRQRIENMSSDQLQGIDLQAIPLLDIGFEPYRLEQLNSDGQPIGRWNVDALPARHSPWLIYPSSTSTMLVRPSLWNMSTFDLLGTMDGIGDRICPLIIAMSRSDAATRNRDLIKVIAEMAVDLDHPSWHLLIHHYKHLQHLPLNTLDYWRVIGRSQDVWLAAVLKFPSDMHQLMLRMRDELGVMWELMSRNNLLKAHDGLSASLLKQFGDSLDRDLMEKIVEDLFDKIGSVSEALAIQVDHTLFEKSGRRTARFEQMIAKFTFDPQMLLQEMWVGADSLLQRILLRNHADETVWPYFKLWEQLLKAISEQCSVAHREFVENLGRQLLWVPQTNPGNSPLNAKLDVVNAPLLAGFFIQACDASNWLQTEDRLSALRQIKSFDPIWFEIGLQTGVLLAKKALHKPTGARRSR